MRIRTFYWHDDVITRVGRVVRGALRRDISRYFTVGNAGDILTPLLIQRVYACPCINVDNAGCRLLVAGSISQRVLAGDIVCGVGVKSRSIPRAEGGDVLVWGLRGPISYDVFKSAGYDVGQVRFLLDPGLMLRFILRSEIMNIQPDGAAFIPHFRERSQIRGQLPKGIRMIDIDATPEQVGRAILGAEVVYSSSLHGIIFAHALQRPVVFVRPQTEEPLLKYEDYFASVDLIMKKPLDSIQDAEFLMSPDSPVDIRFQESDFTFPEKSTLLARGIAAAR